MHTLRRKSQIYPVALAITLLIACKAHAQLCPATAESKDLPGFTEQACLNTIIVKTSGPNHIDRAVPVALQSQTAVTTMANLEPALAPAASAEITSEKLLPPPAVAQASTEASIRPQGDLVRKLLLAESQPAPTETSVQLMFAE